MGINTIKYRDRYIKRAARILPAIQPGVPFAPEAIDKIVGGTYSSKFMFYLRELGFMFDTNKDGRKIVSYTLIKEPDDAGAIRASNASKPRGKNAVTIAKAPKVKVAKSVVAAENAALIRAEVKVEKDIEAIKAKNLETMRKVAAKMKDKTSKKSNKTSKKKTREFDDVTEQFGTSGEVATSFSVDRDWDTLEGCDISKLL